MNLHPLPARIQASTPPYSEIGTSRLVDSDMGQYREAGPKRLDRFCYLFETVGAGDLVRVTLDYPDDKPRACELYLLSERAPAPLNALGSGYLTGGDVPLLGRRLSQAWEFYVPASPRFALVLMTGRTGEPAAFLALTVERVLEPAPGSRRRLGLYWEDPALVTNLSHQVGGRKLSVIQFALVLDRLIERCRATGHNSVIYPVVWYESALWEGGAESDPVVLGKRCEPPDFDRQMAQRLSREGIAFWPSIRNWMLPSLQFWLAGNDKIKAGCTQYVNAVALDGTVRTRSSHHEPPLLNCLHPKVQGALEALMHDIMARVGEHAQGIALWHTIHSSHALGSVDSSVDDCTIERFARACKVTPPEGPVEERFTRWGRWLQDDHWDTWLAWRRDQQTALLVRLAGIAAARKPGAKLALLVLYPAPAVGAGAGVEDPASYLEGIGLDTERLARDQNLSLCRIIQPTPASGTDRAALNWDAAWQKPFLAATTGAVLHYPYWEQSLKDLPRLAQPVGWNGEWSWHVTSPKSAGRHALAPLAQALDLFETQELHHGGFQLGVQGMEDFISEWAAVFTALPAVLFAPLDEDQGVCLRGVETEGKRWFYLLNATAGERPALLLFSCEGWLQSVGRLEPRAWVSPTAPLYLLLAPWELRAWQAPVELVPRLG